MLAPLRLEAIERPSSPPQPLENARVSLRLDESAARPLRLIARRAAVSCQAVGVPASRLEARETQPERARVETGGEAMVDLVLLRARVLRPGALAFLGGVLAGAGDRELAPAALDVVPAKLEQPFQAEPETSHAAPSPSAAASPRTLSSSELASSTPCARKRRSAGSTRRARSMAGSLPAA